MSVEIDLDFTPSISFCDMLDEKIHFILLFNLDGGLELPPVAKKTLFSPKLFP
jgi:hypothetical protein